jgi:16S rRNA (uracil1498-N3)-methyltransferase
MECLYAPDLSEDSDHIALSEDEQLHAKALRLREGDSLLLTNGLGLSANTIVRTISKKEVVCEVVSFLHRQGESNKNVDLYVGLLDNRDRLEWIVEKATELGVSSIQLLNTRYASHKSVKIERLFKIAISATKQCKRSIIPIIYPPIPLQQALESIKTESSAIILADENGKSPSPIHSNQTAYFVGPEGGFSSEEVKSILSQNNSTSITLGKRRLRAETAVIVGLSYLQEI